jgi:hypothetical protein
MSGVWGQWDFLFNTDRMRLVTVTENRKRATEEKQSTQVKTYEKSDRFLRYSSNAMG